MTTIYFNPKCSKCRIAKTFLEEKGETLEIKEYLVNPPNKVELKAILQKLDMPIDTIIRKKEDEWQEFKNQTLSEDELLDILIKHPKLIQRPIIIKGDKAVIGRDEESLREICT